MAAQSKGGEEVPPWRAFQIFGAVLDLVTDLAMPHPFFFDFRTEYFCDAIWQPTLLAEQQQ
jgi:hypothetical protein